jgi:hypothetical protein
VKSLISFLFIAAIVLVQVGSTGFNVSKKTCAHSKEITYSIGNSKCTCKKHTKEVKSCCSSKKEVKKRCCELESIAGCFDFKNTTPSFIDFNPPIYTPEVTVFTDVADLIVYSDQKQELYRPPPNRVFGLDRQVMYQTFVI